MPGPSATLPPTLAQRVRYLRERLHMSPEFLAEKARIPLAMLDDIESGIETFLAPSIRSRLARALQVRPGQLKEVEKGPDSLNLETPVLQRKSLDLIGDIERNPEGRFRCPSCGAPLQVRQFERRDLQDNAFQIIKANCTRCLFRLTND